MVDSVIPKRHCKTNWPLVWIGSLEFMNLVLLSLFIVAFSLEIIKKEGNIFLRIYFWFVNFQVFDITTLCYPKCVLIAIAHCRTYFKWLCYLQHTRGSIFKLMPLLFQELMQTSSLGKSRQQMHIFCLSKALIWLFLSSCLHFMLFFTLYFKNFFFVWFCLHMKIWFRL